MGYKVHKNDVLVIGSGGAGLRTAIELHDKGIDVLVLGKCKRGDAHTVLATGGINAALGTMDSKDSWLVHAADTLKEGRLIADPQEVETLCRFGPLAIKDLIGYGVRFHREKDGRLTQRFFGAHTYRRTCFVGDRTGKAIEEALVKQVLKRKIPFLGEVYITDLLKKDGRINGALGFNVRTGEMLMFNAKAVVLATGGYSRLYRRSSSRIFENTGDGVSLAYAAGAELADMEMTQFHPTGMVWPVDAEGVLVTEAVRGEGGTLTNARNERFMKEYPRAELGPRDVVARAIYDEIREGRGTQHGGVWLDISHRDKTYIKERLPKMYEQFKRVGVDISKEKMEVAPTAHYSMGGVRVDRRTQMTRVPGLFAIGEVTSGVHGANRLGGNSLLEIIVFGKIGGAHIAKFVRNRGFVPLDERQIRKSTAALDELRHSEGTLQPKHLRNELQSMMWGDAGIVRDGKRLKVGLEKLETLRKKSEHTRVRTMEDMVVALDVRGLFVPAEAVLRSALIRKESRGAHYRSDFPKESAKWIVNLVCYKGPRGMTITKKRAAKPKGQLAHALKRAGAEHKFLE